MYGTAGEYIRTPFLHIIFPFPLLLWLNQWALFVSRRRIIVFVLPRGLAEMQLAIWGVKDHLVVYFQLYWWFDQFCLGFCGLWLLWSQYLHGLSVVSASFWYFYHFPGGSTCFSLHASWCMWWREMFGSSELTAVQRPHAVNRSPGDVKATKTSSETKCRTRHIQMVLIMRPKNLPHFCAELLLEHGSNVFCPPVFVSTLCCCAKWLHTCSQKRSPLYSLLLYAAGQIELYQIKLFGPFCCRKVGKC